MMLARWTGLRGVIRQKFQWPIRAFGSSTPAFEKALPPRRKITDDEISESFLRGTGPGGQKINKTSCAVQLKHLATGIVVKSQHTRSREQNRKFARLILGEKLDELEKGEQSRTAIKNERAKTKKASANKKTKRKYKKLAEEKAASDGAEDLDAGAEAHEDVDSANEVMSDSKDGSDKLDSSKVP
ncbi:hypothetical protein Q7P37_011005 [Cladosporium fusiforme]